MNKLFYKQREIMKKNIFLALAIFVANSINASEEPGRPPKMPKGLLDAIEKKAEAKKNKALERLDELSTGLPQIVERFDLA